MNQEEIAALSDRVLNNYKQVVRTCFDYHRQYSSQQNKALVDYYSQTLELINKEILKRKHPEHR